VLAEEEKGSGTFFDNPQQILLRGLDDLRSGSIGIMSPREVFSLVAPHGSSIVHPEPGFFKGQAVGF